MTARDVEAAMLTRCATVAREIVPTAAQDQREANVFRQASMIIRSAFPRESMSLWLASEQYFDTHPNEVLHPSQVVRNGWVIDLPRLRDRLIRQLSYSERSAQISGTATLKFSEFPQLRLIAWNLRHTDTVEERDAYCLYERNWRFVDEANLEASEKALIERLKKQFGGVPLHL